ncbi:MAG: large conductance mechanosensitive channel protein MscL [Firmicutes bacterium]|nr:large conductance mechanosensitive channel protein MscL [Bacillota bacterium]
MKTFLTEFKEFITKGNVMTMATGIIIGSAFTSIVNSLVNDVITPFLGIILGGLDFTSIVINVGEANIMVGNFIQAVISFLLTALVIFTMIKLFNQLQRKKEEEAVEEPAEQEIAPEVQLLTEIRDMLKEK